MKLLIFFFYIFCFVASCSQTSVNSSDEEEGLEEEEGDDEEVETINIPFGSHLNSYTEESILPNHLSQQELDDQTSEFYELWKETYIVQGCGEGNYYVGVNADEDFSGGGAEENTITVSEAHGYGMMIMSLMAGYDDDAQTIFDGMVQFYQDHPATDDNLLMAWNQVEGCDNASEGGDDTATDGDLDIAFAFLLADAQWGSDGAIDYRQLAIDMLAQIEESEIHPDLLTVLLGNWASSEESDYYFGSRSSDWMPDHFRVFASVATTSLWDSVIDTIYDTIALLQTNFSPNTGLISDFVVNLNSSAEPAPEDYLEGETDNDFSYNACRDPWRLGTDYLINGETRAGDALASINNWIRSETGDDPSQILDGYTLEGETNEEGTFNAMSFVAPMGVSAMTDSDNQQWLNDIWELVINTSEDDEEYYGNTLKLLCLIVMSQNWWSP